MYNIANAEPLSEYYLCIRAFALNDMLVPLNPNMPTVEVHFQITSMCSIVQSHACSNEGKLKEDIKTEEEEGDVDGWMLIK